VNVSRRDTNHYVTCLLTVDGGIGRVDLS